MDYISFFVAFIFGTIIGSFLNVVILRFRTGKISKGRSVCFSCSKTLGFLELIPVVSFLALRGRCRGCRSKISWQYPLVEFVTGILFALNSMFTHSSGEFLLISAIFSVLIVIGVYDMKHKIIPDSLAILFALLSLMMLFASHYYLFWSSATLLHLLAGPILFLPFFVIWLFSRGEWMGLGDAKLAVGIGFLLGIVNGISAIIIGIWAGALWSVSLMLAQVIARQKKSISMKSEIPLAPFLILGTIIVYFFPVDILGVRIFFDLFF